MTNRGFSRCQAAGEQRESGGKSSLLGSEGTVRNSSVRTPRKHRGIDRPRRLENPSFAPRSQPDDSLGSIEATLLEGPCPCSTTTRSPRESSLRRNRWLRFAATTPTLRRRSRRAWSRRSFRNGSVTSHSPLGRWRFGVELHEFGREETPRWVAVGTPVQQIKLPHEWGRVRLADVAWLAIVEARDFLADADTAEPITIMGVRVGLLKPKPRFTPRKSAARSAVAKGRR